MQSNGYILGQKPARWTAWNTMTVCQSARHGFAPCQFTPTPTAHIYPARSRLSSISWILPRQWLDFLGREREEGRPAQSLQPIRTRPELDPTLPFGWCFASNLRGLTRVLGGGRCRRLATRRWDRRNREANKGIYADGRRPKISRERDRLSGERGRPRAKFRRCSCLVRGVGGLPFPFRPIGERAGRVFRRPRSFRRRARRPDRQESSPRVLRSRIGQHWQARWP